MYLYKNLQSGFADGMSERSEGIPDSEQIEPTVAEPQRRNSRPADGGYWRAEQIQEGGFSVGL